MVSRSQCSSPTYWQMDMSRSNLRDQFFLKIRKTKHSTWRLKCYSVAPTKSLTDWNNGMSSIVLKHVRIQEHLKTSRAFIDLTAAFHTAWRQTMIYKFLKMIPCFTTANFINKILVDREFQLVLDGKKITKRLSPRSVLTPLRFSIYITD